MGYRFQISANILTWPKICACCGDVANTVCRAPASRTTGVRVQHTRTNWWEVPYCSHCLNHINQWDVATHWLIYGAVGGAALCVIIGQASKSGMAGFICGLALFALSFIPYNKAREDAVKLRKPTCASTGSAVQYIEWYGTMHTFIFESGKYLERFLNENSRKKRSDITRV